MSKPTVGFIEALSNMGVADGGLSREGRLPAC